MDSYFERLYYRDGIIYSLDFQAPFIDTRGGLTKETYFIEKGIYEGDEIIWSIIASYENKQEAIKNFESLIK